MWSSKDSPTGCLPQPNTRLLLYLGSLGLPQDKAVVSAFEFGGLFGAMLCPMAMDWWASVISNRRFCICLTLLQTGFARLTVKPSSPLCPPLLVSILLLS